MSWGVYTLRLRRQGTLFLGHAEMLLSHGDRFTPLNLKHRIFRKAAGPTPARIATTRRGVLRTPRRPGRA